jgi:hypothetical protein
MERWDPWSASPVERGSPGEMLIRDLLELAEKLQSIQDADRIYVGHDQLLRLVDTCRLRQIGLEMKSAAPEMMNSVRAEIPTNTPEQPLSHSLGEGHSGAFEAETACGPSAS